MKTRNLKLCTKYLLGLIISILLLSCSYTNTNDVRACFEGYKIALLNNNGKEALKYINKNTIDYYSKMADFARLIKYKDLREESLLTKLMVIRLRQSATYEELMSFNGESLLLWSIEKGMIGRENVRNASIGRVEFDEEDRLAQGEFINYGNRTTLKYSFTKDNETWKIDLTTLLPLAEKELQKQQKYQEKTDDAFIADMVESVTGRKVDPEIWFKIKK